MTRRIQTTRLFYLLRDALWASLLLASLSGAAAHATIVFGTLTVEPNPPPVAEPFELSLTIDDPTGVPVEDAVVLAEFSLGTDGGALDQDTPVVDQPAAPLATAEFRETSPGTYRADVTLPRGGSYRLLLRDRTFQQEEATQLVTLTVGGEEPLEPIEFIFPPTATDAGLRTWLIWLIVLPLAAGVIVTLLVLRGGRDPGTDAAAADAG